jgi:O-antigen/teichoic acid export membrane protein
MRNNESERGYGHILKYTGIFGGVQGLNILIGLVRNKIVASLLGPDGMGLVSLFNSTVNFISQATNLGISFSAVRHVSELFDTGDEERIAHFIKVVRAWSLLTGLVGMLVCFIAGPLLSSYTFSWGDHTLHFILLGPAVALTAISGGETAILKGARRLRALAMIQLVSVALALIISFPLYYFLNQTGIVPVIVLMALATMLCTVWYSYRFYPLRLRGSRGLLGEGMDMVRLGVGFLAAGVLGSGAEMLVRAYLNVAGGLDVVGIYNAGFMMTMTYGGMVFTAMETDYFPRLSAVNNDIALCNQTVNRQIEVSLIIISPMLVAMLFATPILIPLLFTGKFLPVVGMMRITTLALYLRALKLPVCYLTLAKGDALSFMLMEGVYAVEMVLMVILGYNWWGIDGTGAGLLMAALLEFVMINAYTHFKYSFSMTRSIAHYAIPQLLLGLTAYVAATTTSGLAYWTAATLLFAASLAFSLRVLRSKTALWAKLKDNMKQKFRGHV